MYESTASIYYYAAKENQLQYSTTLFHLFLKFPYQLAIIFNKGCKIVARQVIIVQTEQDIAEINALLTEYFTAEEFEYKNYRGEVTLVREDRFGRRFFMVNHKPGTLKIEVWIKNGKGELALDNKLYGAKPKRGLHMDVNNLMQLFSSQQCSSFNSDTVEGSLLNDGYQIQTYKLLNSNFKQYPILSLGIGIVCFAVPLPENLIIVASAVAFYCGMKGVRSSMKWASFLGISLSIVNLVMSISVY